MILLTNEICEKKVTAQMINIEKNDRVNKTFGKPFNNVKVVADSGNISYNLNF